MYSAVLTHKLFSHVLAHNNYLPVEIQHALDLNEATHKGRNRNVFDVLSAQHVCNAFVLLARSVVNVRMFDLCNMHAS